MKIETAELQFIRDDYGRRWVYGDQPSYHWSYANMTRAKAYEKLVTMGYLTPDPLEEALKALYKLKSNYGWHDKGYGQVASIVHKLAADLTA